MNNGGHRSRRGTVQNAHAVPQIACELLLRPRCWSRICGGQRWSGPVVDHRSGIGIARLFRAEQIARRVTSAAMAQPQREVSAPVPLLALAGDPFEAAGSEKQNLPARLEGADAER